MLNEQRSITADTALRLAFRGRSSLYAGPKLIS